MATEDLYRDERCASCEASGSNMNPSRVRMFECTSARRHFFVCCSGKCQHKFEQYCEQQIKGSAGKADKRKAEIARNQGKINCPNCFFTMKPVHDVDALEEDPDPGDDVVVKPTQGRKGKMQDGLEALSQVDEFGERSTDPEVAAMELRLEAVLSSNDAELLERALEERGQLGGRGGERLRNLAIRAQKKLKEVREREAAFGAPAASSVDAEVLAEALAEANRTIEEHEKAIQENERTLTELSGAAAKKEKKALEKFIRNMKLDEEYVAAQRMVKDPMKELARRAETMGEQKKLEEVLCGASGSSSIDTLKRALARAKDGGLTRKNKYFAQIENELDKLVALSQEKNREEEEAKGKDRRERLAELDRIRVEEAKRRAVRDPTKHLEELAQDAFGFAPPDREEGSEAQEDKARSTKPDEWGTWTASTLASSSPPTSSSTISTQAPASFQAIQPRPPQPAKPPPPPAATSAAAAAAATSLASGVDKALDRVASAAAQPPAAQPPAAQPPAPQPPVAPKAPLIATLYSWPEQKVVQLSAGSREKNQRLLDPPTIAFRDDQVLLAHDNSEKGVNAFFNNFFPEGPVMEDFVTALAKRLEEPWRPPVPRPTGAPPPCPAAGPLVVRATASYEAAGGATLPVAAGDLFILDRGIQSQENGWVFARRVVPAGALSAPETGWVPALAVAEEHGHHAAVLRSAAASAGGYISVTAGDNVVVTHTEQAWVYGYKADTRQPDVSLRGWFPRATLVRAPKK